MPDNMEKLIKAVYKRWKKDRPGAAKPHPDEEALALFFEGRLSGKENDSIKAHLTACERCSEAFSIQARLKAGEEKYVPQELIMRMKDLVTQKKEPLFLKILLRLKDEALEVIDTTGDLLSGRELIPAAALRSRKIKDFRDEVTILKDFKGIRVEVKMENKRAGYFKLSVVAREKKTQAVIRDLRFALFKDDLELESCLNDSGKAAFENLALGKYTVEITDIKDKLASILLEIRA